MMRPETDIGVCRQMEHHLAALHRLFEKVEIEQVAVDQMEKRGLTRLANERREACRKIIVGGDLVAAGKQGVSQIATDETCGARYKILHSAAPR